MTKVASVAAGVISLAAVLCLSGCISEDKSDPLVEGHRVYNPHISSIENVSDLRVGLKKLSAYDGPRGVTISLTKYDPGRTKLEAKCDESIDFIDTIIAIMRADEAMSPSMKPDGYYVKYSGVYIPHSGEFYIKRSSLDAIEAKDIEAVPITDIARRMSQGEFGKELISHGQYLLKNGYRPSSTKDEMYLGRKDEPRVRINIY